MCGLLERSESLIFEPCFQSCGISQYPVATQTSHSARRWKENRYSRTTTNWRSPEGSRGPDRVPWALRENHHYKINTNHLQMGPETFWWWDVPVHCASPHLRMLGCFRKPSGTAFPCLCACGGMRACAVASVALCCDSDPSLCGLSCLCSWHLNRNRM